VTRTQILKENLGRKTKRQTGMRDWIKTVHLAGGENFYRLKKTFNSANGYTITQCRRQQIHRNYAKSRYRTPARYFIRFMWLWNANEKKWQSDAPLTTKNSSNELTILKMQARFWAMYIPEMVSFSDGIIHIEKIFNGFIQKRRSARKE